MVTSQPLQRAGSGEGEALTKEKEQGRGEDITAETLGEKRAAHCDKRMNREGLVANSTWLPSFSLPRALRVSQPPA